ncbi:uncharacterized protein LOC143843961 isoform X4 [Paroedura picta]|uniref:uncharacterized protein LOC143843961 isoform X4 n=1 Tax=Paroedura picta TaxID=143630 RepID=UPI00405757BC
MKRGCRSPRRRGGGGKEKGNLRISLCSETFLWAAQLHENLVSCCQVSSVSGKRSYPASPLKRDLPLSLTQKLQLVQNVAVRVVIGTSRRAQVQLFLRQQPWLLVVHWIKFKCRVWHEMDVHYLKEHLGNCLVEGLAQVAERQPADPIDFLACWIYRYKQNLNGEEKRKIEWAQLEQEREVARAELERIEKLKAEELQMAQKCEEQQKAFTEQPLEKRTTVGSPEKSGVPSLPTVVEIDESHLNGTLFRF